MSSIDILLYGGGIDSTSLLLHMVKNLALKPLVMHVDYGQKAVLEETAAARYFSEKYQLEAQFRKVDLSFSRAAIMQGSDGNTASAEDNRLELRNLVLLSYAASYGASLRTETTLYVGFHREPENSGFEDAKIGYLSSLMEAMLLSTKRVVRIEAPFNELTRQEIFNLGHDLDSDILSQSYTCYESGGPCGKCAHCLERSRMVSRLIKRVEI